MKKMLLSDLKIGMALYQWLLIMQGLIHLLLRCVIELLIINAEDWVAVLVRLVNLLDGVWEPDDYVPHPGENKHCAHHKRTSLRLSKEFIHFSSSCVKPEKHLQAQSLKLCIQRPTSPLLCTVGG